MNFWDIQFTPKPSSFFSSSLSLPRPTNQRRKKKKKLIEKFCRVRQGKILDPKLRFNLKVTLSSPQIFQISFDSNLCVFFIWVCKSISSLIYVDAIGQMLVYVLVQGSMVLIYVLAHVFDAMLVRQYGLHVCP